MLDDTRSEVKVKTEKLVKKLHFLVGSQVVDMCPQNKLQRVQDIIFRPGETGGASSSGGAGNTSTSLAAGGGTFGAVGAANLILQSQATRGSRLDWAPDQMLRYELKHWQHQLNELIDTKNKR